LCPDGNGSPEWGHPEDHLQAGTLDYKQGLWIVGIGLLLDLGGAFAAAHLLSSMMVVSATDPATYLSISAILAAIAILACCIPTRRAMHFEPLQALRAE
jgi:putative ABC transport system permease protein